MSDLSRVRRDDVLVLGRAVGTDCGRCIHRESYLFLQGAVVVDSSIGHSRRVTDTDSTRVRINVRSVDEDTS